MVTEVPDLLAALQRSVDRACADRKAATCSTTGCDGSPFCKGMCRRCYNRAYYAANRDHELVRQRAWQAANPEKAAAARARRDPESMRRQARQWYADNRLRALAAQANIRASRAGVPGLVTAEQLLARLLYFGNRCYLCGGVPNGFDHVKPLTAGGPNFASNLRPCCVPCNSTKGTTWKAI